MNDRQCSSDPMCNQDEFSEKEAKSGDGLDEFQNFFAELHVFDATTTAMCPPSPKRPRRTYDESELNRLEEVFAGNSYPDRERRIALAQEIGVSPKHIQIWFQNRRARERILRRKAEGIMENPIDRMRIHLTHLPPPSQQLTLKTEKHKASRIKSNLLPSTLTQCKETTKNSQQQGQEHHHQHIRMPLRTISSCSNVGQQVLETPLPNNNTTQSNFVSDFSQLSSVQQFPATASTTVTSFPVTVTTSCNSQIHLPNTPHQVSNFSLLGKLTDVTDSVTSASYCVTFGSISNLSDISNSSFTELLSTTENEELLSVTDPTNDHFSPLLDAVFDF